MAEDESKEVRYENMLMSILQNEQRIEPFLDSIFNFLHKRTDLFLVQETPEQKYGFPNGVARNTVLKIFDKYDKLNKNKIKEKLSDEMKCDTAIKTKQKEVAQVEQAPVRQEKSEIKDELKAKQKIFQSNPDSYNGAIRDNYSWTQSIKDIDVNVKINKNVLKSKDVNIKIEKQHLKVEVRSDTNNAEWVKLIDDNLPWKIRVDDCTWSIFAGNYININLEKSEERWWENLLENEDKLNLHNMNPEKPLHDLEPEAQAKIQQLMYDEQRKRLGRPTSEEEKNHEMLRKAWNAEGSPFAGQPFDPSKFDIKNSNITFNP